MDLGPRNSYYSFTIYYIYLNNDVCINNKGFQPNHPSIHSSEVQQTAQSQKVLFSKLV